jgi:lysine-ketoglutarate reductase/saccharopine dehydrogenase-like protein (TIGR00300 family)
MVSEEVTLEGHIIDSLVLTRVLDDITSLGGDFRILEVHIGQSRHDRSHARLEVQADDEQKLDALLAQIGKHGALVRDISDGDLQPADVDGAFPEDFFATTNQQTCVRHRGQWIKVEDQEMDCGVVFEPSSRRFRCVPVTKVRRGDLVVCGHRGVKVVPIERQREPGVFEFMASEISTEKPKSAIIKQCARLMVRTQRDGGRLLLVGGPAIVHTGSTEHVVRLIERGYVHVLFGGNAIAAHDIENAIYGTSLGVYVDQAILADTGHEHHLRAINTIRRCGGIRAAVERGVIRGGIMHACIRHSVDFVLAGSVRDDGPLPEVITDMLVAQDRMRAASRGVSFALMVATGLHSIATGNILPAWIPAVCVDINPSVLTKLADRGSFQTIGLVTDVEPFFRELVYEIEAVEGAER